MIVVAIATILFALAVPRTSPTSPVAPYRGQDRPAGPGRTGRALLSTTPPPIRPCPGTWGTPGFGAANPVGNGYYFLTVCSPAALAALPIPRRLPPFGLGDPGRRSEPGSGLQCTSYSVTRLGSSLRPARKQRCTAGKLVLSNPTDTLPYSSNTRASSPAKLRLGMRTASWCTRRAGRAPYFFSRV